jgi:hypothetical protein
MQPTWNTTGIAHEHGDVEPSHHHFTRSVDQTFQARGSRACATRVASENVLQHLIHTCTQTRTGRVAAERAVLHPLPASVLALWKELHIVVSRFSTLTVATTVSFVPSRLIGTTSLVRVRPRQRGTQAASHRVSACDSFSGTQAWRVRVLSLPRRPLPDSHLSPCL